MSLLYELTAKEVANNITTGLLRAGDRLPGVRSYSRKRGISIATVLSAYRLLEDDGFIESRPRSGFYVKQRKPVASIVKAVPVKTQPQWVTGQEMALALTKAASDPAVIQLGAAVPDLQYLPVRAIQRATHNAMRRFGSRVSGYEMPPGSLELRRQIALWMTSAGASIEADEVLITSGCQEALRLALQAVTGPGDLIAIESPTFYGSLQVLQALGLEALEIPTDPITGMSLPALSLALERWPVKAVLSVPNNNNPLGFVVSDQRKRELVELLTQHGVPLIEDDVYGELCFDGRRAAPYKTLCPDADIIYCSSFSKTLSPGSRIGWVVGGRHQGRMEYLKYISNIAAASLPQLALADYLESGAYERYLKSVRSRYARAVARMSDAVSRVFPVATKITQPQGGFVLWLELPEDINCFAVAQKSLLQGVSIAPGGLFSASQKYQNYMRLSCACRWDSGVEQALGVLARNF